jgi:hypothetical protein
MRIPGLCYRVPGTRPFHPHPILIVLVLDRFRFKLYARNPSRPCRRPSYPYDRRRNLQEVGRMYKGNKGRSFARATEKATRTIARSRSTDVNPWLSFLGFPENLGIEPS